MPKLAQYTLIWSAEHSRYELNNGSEVSSMNETAWVRWLNAHHSFAFIGRNGRLNLLKERRKANYDYWYAYRRHGKRVEKRYAGRSAELTFAQLEELGHAFSGEDDHPVVPQPEESLDITDRDGFAAPLPLLTSKFRLPQLLHSLVPRERLLAQLDAGREGKLTVVSASAGFGKTTLVRQWLEKVGEANVPTKVAWLSLDANDNDLLRFWHYLITACRVFAPNIGFQSLTWLDAPISIQSPVDTLSMVFVNELESIRGKAILVLEDYHVITVPVIHEILSFLLDNLPPSLHLVLITRTTPPLPLARLRAASQLTEIEAPDLRFSETETSAFLRLNTNLPVSRDEISEIESRVEGWAAGLRLLTLALQGRQDAESIRLILANFVAGRRGIGDYFVSEVLNNQPAPLQQFLLQTSFLSSLTASLCDDVTLRNDSQELLELLHQANLFLEPLDGVGLWYRYHALFATAMQAEARRRMGEDTVRTLLERAGYWYEAHSMIGEAIDAAFAANNIPRATDLINNVVEREYAVEGAQPPHPPEFYNLQSWLVRLPQSLIDERPLLSLGVANVILFGSLIEERSLSSTDTEKIEQALRNAERGFNTSDQTDLLGQVYALRGFLYCDQGQLTRAAEWAQKALPLFLLQEAMWRSLCINMLGQAEEFLGQLVSAEDQFREAYELCVKTDNEQLARLHSLMLGRVYVEQNKFHQATSLFLHALDEAKTVGDFADVYNALCGLTLISLYHNDLGAAWTWAVELLEIVAQYPHTSSHVDAVLTVAGVEFARGEVEAARQRSQTLLTAQLTTITPREKQLSAQIAYELAKIALSTGDLNAVQRWRANRLNTLEQPRIRTDEEDILLARLLIAEGKPGDAALQLESVMDDALREGRERIALEMRVWLALAYAADHQQQRACVTLMTALADASPANVRRIFIDAGEPLAALLRVILPILVDKHLAAFARTLLRALPTSTFAPDESLSPQERRVLSLIADGRSNTDIAAELVVSVNTIKAHVKAIYRKLKVNNRVEATRVARDLELL